MRKLILVMILLVCNYSYSQEKALISDSNWVVCLINGIVKEANVDINSFQIVSDWKEFYNESMTLSIKSYDLKYLADLDDFFILTEGFKIDKKRNNTVFIFKPFNNELITSGKTINIPILVYSTKQNNYKKYIAKLKFDFEKQVFYFNHLIFAYSVR